jgi:hypothetical protein
MCNLYSLTRNRDAIPRLFRVSHNRATAFGPLPATSQATRRRSSAASARASSAKNSANLILPSPEFGSVTRIVQLQGRKRAPTVGAAIARNTGTERLLRSAAPLTLFRVGGKSQRRPCQGNAAHHCQSCHFHIGTPDSDAARVGPSRSLSARWEKVAICP